MLTGGVNMTKGERIRRRREELGLSQTYVADKIEVRKQTLYKYENDIISNIPSDKIEALAKILNTTESYLMGWSEKKENSLNKTITQKSKFAEAALKLYPDTNVTKDFIKALKTEELNIVSKKHPSIPKAKRFNVSNTGVCQFTYERFSYGVVGEYL